MHVSKPYVRVLGVLSLVLYSSEVNRLPTTAVVL